MAEINDLNVTDASNTDRFPEGMLASDVNDSARALEGLIARWHKDTNASITAGGTADALTVAANQTLSAYYDGLVIAFEAAAANTGAATLDVDGVGAATIKKNNNSDLAAGDIDAGQKVIVIYDGTNWQMISQVGNPGGSGDVVGPASATDSAVALYDGTTGKLLKDGVPLGVASGNIQVVNQAETSTASATTTALGTTLKHLITGTTTITAFSGVAGVTYHCTAGGAFTLTHHATNLDILQTGANITTAADDTFDVYMRTASTAEIRNYQRADGTALVAGASGKLLQSLHTSTAATSSGSTTIPYDDTIPQNTEGTELFTQAITPSDASNIIEIEAIVQYSQGTIGQVALALFQDSTADAIFTQTAYRPSGDVNTSTLLYRMTAGTTSPTTFKLRYGAQSGTVYINQISTGRKYGGTLISSMTVREISA